MGASTRSSVSYDHQVDSYGPETYGEAFADVYDDWYGEVSDVEATVEAVVSLAGGGRVLELGVGTGRLAIPLRRRGVDVEGIDASPAMLALLAAKPHGSGVPVHFGDMAELDVGGTFGAVFVAFNTFFNLTTDVAQRRCLTRIAELLDPTGCFAIEAFVPAPPPSEPEQRSSQRDDGAGGVIVTTTDHRPVDQLVIGEHVHTDASGATVRRPWQIRYLSPAQLDTACADAGLRLQDRWADWSGTPFDPAGDRHVSVYRPT